MHHPDRKRSTRKKAGEDEKPENYGAEAAESASLSSSKLVKVILIFSLIVLTVVILWFARPLLLPLAIAAILAMVLNPFMDWLLNRGLPRWLAIIIPVLFLLAIITGLLLLLNIQIHIISKDWPEIQRKFSLWTEKGEAYLFRNFHLEKSQINEALPGIGAIVKPVVGSVTQVLSDCFLILIYLILLLMQREHFKKFILRLVPSLKRNTAQKAIDECVSTSSRFLIGRLKIMLIAAVLYFVGFWLGNVPYAFFLALIAALFSIIPWLGNIIGGGIACILALAIGGPSSVLIIVIVMTTEQVLENYLFIPWILGNAVKLDPFVTIVSVVGFTLLWGVVGAVIALPIVAMLRILLHNLPGMEPYADFLGVNRKRKKRR